MIFVVLSLQIFSSRIQPSRGRSLSNRIGYSRFSLSLSVLEEEVEVEVESSVDEDLDSFEVEAESTLSSKINLLAMSTGTLPKD